MRTATTASENETRKPITKKQAAIQERRTEAGYAGKPMTPDTVSGETALDSWTQGTKTVLYMRVAFPDDPAEPVSLETAYTLMGQVAQFYRENSYGSLELATVVTPLLMLPQTKTAYGLLGDSRLQEDARQAARAAGFETENYDLDIVRHNRVPGFNWNGKSWVGQKGLWMQTSSTGDTTHELGHNLGLKHANFWSATGDSIIGPGSVTDYGNPFDTMGSGNAGSFQFNACYKSKLDWLPSSFVVSATNSAIYRLYALDSAMLVAGEHYALKVPKDFARDYWVEFRQRIAGNPWLMNGVLLNWNPWSAGNATSSGTTTLLDTSPGTPTGNSSREDAALVIGQTFSDRSAGVHLTPTAKGSDSLGNWIEVQVNLGEFISNRPPQLEMIAAQTNVPVGVPVAFEAMGSDPDGDAVAYSWDFGDLTFGTNGSAVSKAWASNGVFLLRCVVSDMRGGRASRQVAIRVGTPSLWAATGRITNQVGEPVEGVRVHNGLSGSLYRGGYTDSDGFYSLVNLPAGSVTLGAVQYGLTLAASGWTNPVSGGPDVAGLDWQARAMPIVTLSAPDPVARVSQPGSSPDTATFLFTRTGALASSLTVRFSLTGTAFYGQTADYVLYPPPVGSPMSISLAAGAASTNMVLTATNYRAAGAPPKSVTCTILEDGAYVKGTLAAATVALLDAQPPPLPVVNVTVSDDRALEAGQDPAAITFSRDGDLSSSLTVTYSVTGTASNGIDYELLPGVLEFPPGVGTLILPVRPIDDVEPEPDETVAVLLMPGSSYDLGVSTTAVITVMDDDPQSVVVVATDPQCRENSSDMGMFTVTRTGSLAANLLVSYSLSGSASNGLDYAFLPGTMLIPAGQATATIPVTPLNDSLLEGAETIVAVLKSSPAYNIANPGQATVILTDDEMPGVTVTASDTTAAEPGANAGAFTFTRSGSTASPLTVYFDLYGTALNGADYLALSNSIVIPAGTNAALLIVTPVDNLIRETNESVILVLCDDPAYSRITTTPQIVTIADDDGAATVGVGFASAASSVAESGGYAQVGVSLSATSADPVTVDYAVTGGTATGDGVDFLLSAGTLTFAPREFYQSIFIELTDDSLIESNETIIVTLSNPSGALLDSTTHHICTILDDETLVTVSAVDPTASEAGPDTAVFRITRTGDINNDMTVFFQVTGSASSPSDFLPLQSPTVIPAGQRWVDVIVKPVDDATAERDETVTLTLLSVSQGRIDASPSATVTITDNDPADTLPVVDLVASNPLAAEWGLKPGSLQITRDRGTNVPLTVAFSVGGSAASGADFEPLGDSITIPAGESSITLVLTPRDDALYEGNETAVLTLTVQSDYRVAPQAAAATITIIDDEVSPPPTIVIQPAGQTVTVNSNAIFSVSATGAPPLLYQWFHNDTNLITGATNEILLLTNVQDADAGLYSVVVSNWLAVVSSNAQLVVNHLPVPASPRIERYLGTGARVQVTALLGTDPDGDSLYLSAVSSNSAKGGSVSTNSGRVLYLPPAGLTNDDWFAYTVADGRGGFSPSTVTVAVSTNPGPSLKISWDGSGEGAAILDGRGIAGQDYAIEFTESLENLDWQPLAVITADQSGLFGYVDRTLSSMTSRFYRLSCQ